MTNILKMACMPFQVQTTALVTPDVHQQNLLSRRLKFGMKPNRHLSMPCKAEIDERILDPDGYKDRVRQMWHKRASDYDFQNDFHPQLCEQLVATAHIKPGSFNLLDVASGTGTVALSAARALGSEGVVTAVDVSTAMLAKVVSEDGKHTGKHTRTSVLYPQQDLLAADTDAAKLFSALASVVV